MKINIEIPKNFINKGSSDNINLAPLKDKILIGCLGLARSGKDTLGNLMVKHLNFQRISFGDILKKDLDTYMRTQIFDDLKDKGKKINLSEIQFLNPVTLEIKEILRPYMIWFGEEMKVLNGIHHWTNRALSEIGEQKKIVITDVRRINELGLFENNREYNKKIDNINVNMNPGHHLFKNDNNDYQSLLIHINQLGLTDTDQKTIDAIRIAQEKWLINEAIYVDSRIPDKLDYRDKHMMSHLHNLVKKFPDYFV